MTLPLNSRLSALYETNGTQKDFSFGFRVFFDPDNGGYGLEVRRQTADGYEVIPKSDYLVLPVEDNSAGIVRFSVAPSAGQQIYIAGKTPTIQQLVLTNFGRYSAESIETQFDFITAIIQEWLSALGEETRQRIAADGILTQYVVQRIDAFVQQINQNWDDKSQEIEDYINTIMPSFTQTLRDEIEAYAVAGMQDAIDATLAGAKSEIDDAVARANAAANAAAITGKVYDTPEAGVAPVTGVQNGAYYNVRSPDDDSFLVEYQNIGGVPTPSGKSYPSSAALNALKDAIIDPDTGTASASKVFDDKGNSLQDVSNSVVQLIQNIESLRNYKGNKNKQQVGTLEYHADSGYGGALYQWDSSSNAVDDGFSVIAVTGVSTGRWTLQLKDKTLHATQAGLKANLLQTDLVNQSAILQKCIDYMALIGGGKVKLPKGHIYAQVLAKSNVHIEGTFESFVTTKTYAEIAANPTGVVQAVRYEHGTFWHSTGSTDLFYMPENVSNCEISNLKMLGLRLDQSTSACGFGMRIIGDSCTARYVDTSGFRFEGLYIRGVVGADCGNHYFENCNFDDARRNTAALVFCHDVHFKNCKFRQLKPELSWVYLFDIEPNPSTADTVYNVTMENCEFNAVSSSGAEPTVLVKEQNTPTGSPNVKFLNCRFKGVATIRNNCANGWKDCIVDNCEFDTWAFSTTLGYTIISGRFTNNRLYGIGFKGFSFNTPATGDFIIEGNIFNDTVFNGNIITNQASFGLNTFTGTAHVVAPVDRRSITAQYRTITAAEVVSPASETLPAINYIAVRQVNLTTTLSDILTVRLRSGVKVTITGCDANDGTGSKAFVELFINSDNTTSLTAANEIMNPATYGLTFAWNGRTLQLAGKSAAANQFIVKVEVLSALSQYKDVAWLI